MEDILDCCCGLDVHKESIVACLLKGPLGRLGQAAARDTRGWNPIQGSNRTAQLAGGRRLPPCSNGKHRNILVTGECRARACVR